MVYLKNNAAIIKDPPEGQFYMHTNAEEIVSIPGTRITLKNF